MAVPVRVGHETIGFLLTGKVLREPPTEKGFEEFCQNLSRISAGMDPEALRDAYFRMHVVPGKSQKAILLLLGDFAEHLGEIANRLTLESCTKSRICSSASGATSTITSTRNCPSRSFRPGSAAASSTCASSSNVISE